ncbi:hypothetical protein B9Q06_00965 [Candidatus Marsarchaeota G2 archaeon ECH_B_2]|uniref:Uncharacterized protein n=4 Tax=Candidatus Marsarchaeota group 2 TaxID=2203771 RepID=A0A2R6BDL2_9ARCH|nr:MAG: hypothetical protein B9Q06_00965 [Candidatus Marsarchaeota G2 archaeon ECH_B_2]PSO01313.1 MAG: hypothetical protein B9Q07_00375 [Candidatus Marsarchaeota G2 archaeon ECH_B_3]PSO03446.1 MAG: hypothetical protein B9Q05_00965 [Candidatus Marsarchaeota G2 archaeon ECH_B_1]
MMCSDKPPSVCVTSTLFTSALIALGSLLRMGVKSVFSRLMLLKLLALSLRYQKEVPEEALNGAS